MTEHDRPSDDGQEHDWPDDLWPDDDDDDEGTRESYPWPADWPGSSGGPGPGLPGPGARSASWPRWVRLALVAAAGLAAGAVVALAIRDIGGASPTTAAQSETGQSPPAQAGGLPPGGQQPSGLSGTLLVGGEVRAVSPTSITIAAGPNSITATVTSATRFSGQVTRIGQVRVGDMVMAQIAESNARGSVVALQDPASQP